MCTGGFESFAPHIIITTGVRELYIYIRIIAMRIATELANKKKKYLHVFVFEYTEESCSVQTHYYISISTAKGPGGDELFKRSTRAAKITLRARTA